MKTKLYKLISRSKILLLALITLVTVVGCNFSKGDKVQSSAVAENKTATKGYSESAFNVDVSIKYRVFIDDKLKDVNPNIIKAARTCIFKIKCESAKLVHYNGYNENSDILISDVVERGDDMWDVTYSTKTPESDTFGTDCGLLYVTREKSGEYIGGYSHSSQNTLLSGKETY